MRSPRAIERYVRTVLLQTRVVGRVLFAGDSLIGLESVETRCGSSPAGERTSAPIRSGLVPSVQRALPALRQDHAHELTALPCVEIYPFQKLAEGHPCPPLLCVIDHSQQNHFIDH